MRFSILNASILIVAFTACSSTGSPTTPSSSDAASSSSSRVVQSTMRSAGDSDGGNPNCPQGVVQSGGDTPQFSNCSQQSYQPDPAFQGQLGTALGGSVGFGNGGCAGKLCYQLPQPPQKIVCGSPLPSQCAGVPCSGSPETIGDLIPGPTAGSYLTITDINGVWDDQGHPTGGLVVGWMYKAGGKTFFQPNFANQAVWGGSMGAALGADFGISVTGAGGYGAVKPWNGFLPPGSFPLRCESGGATFA